jgi:hypothetical protein
MAPTGGVFSWRRMEDSNPRGSVITVREINHYMKVDGVLQAVDTVWVYKVINDRIAYMHVSSPDQESREALYSVTK